MPGPRPRGRRRPRRARRRCRPGRASGSTSARAPSSRGIVQVVPETAYTRELGYGFDLGSRVTGLDRGGDDALRGDFCTGERPFFFSVALPEGNYRVTVTLGDRVDATVTTVKAESRRLMLERVRTRARHVRDPDLRRQRPDPADPRRGAGPAQGSRAGRPALGRQADARVQRRPSLRLCAGDRAGGRRHDRLPGGRLDGDRPAARALE